MVSVQDFISSLSLQVLSPTTRTEWDIHSAELNRPGLQFVGFTIILPTSGRRSSGWLK